MEAVRLSPLVDLLTELLQGYRHPAVICTEEGAIVCMNVAATRTICPKPDADGARIEDWPRRAAIRADGQTYYLAVPDEAVVGDVTDGKLPPRLGRIARLVIAGHTDKQIADRTGLSFSTVRTYVRQIYRRFGVHSRVELLHAHVARA